MRYWIALMLIVTVLTGCASAGLDAGTLPHSQPPTSQPATDSQPADLPPTTSAAPATSVPPATGPHNRHPYDALWNLNLPKLSDIQLLQIRTDYCAQFNGNYKPEDVSLWFIGIFDETYVLFADVPDRMYLTWITTDVVAGYTFVYGSSHQMEVYHEGSFYGLEEAHAAGYLSNEDVAKLYENYCSAFPNFSEEQYE